MLYPQLAVLSLRDQGTTLPCVVHSRLRHTVTQPNPVSFAFPLLSRAGEFMGFSHFNAKVRRSYMSPWEGTICVGLLRRR
jgi:hypothetical protein